MLVAVVALAGCGGGGGSGHGGMMGGDGMAGGGMMTGRAGSTPAATTGSATHPDGAALFVSSGCGGCHTLAAAGATGAVGPNLDSTRPDYDTVVRRVRDGGGGMPGFGGTLTSAQIDAIARYVVASTR